jgi:hypothetical protein
MKGRFVAGGVAVAAVFIGVYWLARDPAPLVPDPVTPAQPLVPLDAAPEPAIDAATSVPQQQVAPRRPSVADPRLAALMGQPDHPLVEYLSDPEGRLIREIDNDPNSQGYRKPLREYLYAGDRVVAIVVNTYLGNQVQIIRASVTYKPDGTVDQYRETTEYQKP